MGSHLKSHRRQENNSMTVNPNNNNNNEKNKNESNNENNNIINNDNKENKKNEINNESNNENINNNQTETKNENDNENNEDDDDDDEDTKDIKKDDNNEGDTNNNDKNKDNIKDLIKKSLDDEDIRKNIKDACQALLNLEEAKNDKERWVREYKDFCKDLIFIEKNKITVRVNQKFAREFRINFTIFSNIGKEFPTLDSKDDSIELIETKTCYPHYEGTTGGATHKIFVFKATKKGKFKIKFSDHTIKVRVTE